MSSFVFVHLNGEESFSPRRSQRSSSSLSPRPSIYYPRSPNTQTAVSQEDRTLVCSHRDCRVWVRREPVSGFFPYPCRRGVVLCVWVGWRGHPNLNRRPSSFLVCVCRTKGPPRYPTTKKLLLSYDGSILGARTMCTDDDMPAPKGRYLTRPSTEESSTGKQCFRVRPQSPDCDR